MKVQFWACREILRQSYRNTKKLKKKEELSRDYGFKIGLVKDLPLGIQDYGGIGSLIIVSIKIGIK